MLTVFTSASEQELLNERAVAVQIVEYLGLRAIASEKRTAHPISIQKWYKSKVMESDIYLGIFGSIYSPPTIEEYEIAAAQGKPLLLFEKLLGTRDKDLTEFLDRVKHGTRNVVVATYSNVIDLKQKIKAAIIEYLSEEYVECRTKRLSKPLGEQYYQARDFAQLLQDAEQPTPLRLGSGAIRTFELQTELQRLQSNTVSASFEGHLTNGFLDLMIMTEDGSKYWVPDGKSWDATKDLGMLTIDNNAYSTSWQFAVPESAKTGPAIGFLGVYEDTIHLPTFNRRLVDYKIKKLMIR